MAATVNQLKELQRGLKAMGLYAGTIDGAWGPLSHGAFMNARRLTEKQRKDAVARLGIDPIFLAYCNATAWSEKVSAQFVESVKLMVTNLGMPASGADDMMACMAWESGESFRPDIKNGAGSGATGLIQFMPATAKGLGTSTAALAKMTAEEQLIYVYDYFKPYRNRLKNLGDLYMAILWPAGIGKQDDWVLWNAETRPTTYRQNAGLDVNKDGVITRGECCAKVTQKLVAGLHPRMLKVS